MEGPSFYIFNNIQKAFFYFETSFCYNRFQMKNSAMMELNRKGLCYLLINQFTGNLYQSFLNFGNFYGHI